MRKALVVGGANGIGLSIATELAKRTDIEKVYIVDKSPLSEEFANEKFEVHQFNLTLEDYSIFDKFQDVDTLMITAGFGRLALFKDMDESMIPLSFNVNTIPVMRIIKRFYHKLESQQDFYCGVMVSIAGFMSSPFFSIYAATKAALKVFIESVNVELLKAGSTNQILNVSPGSLKGTSFTNGKTDLSVTDLWLRLLLRKWRKRTTSIYLNMRKSSKRYSSVIRMISVRRGHIRMIIKLNQEGFNIILGIKRNRKR